MTPDDFKRLQAHAAHESDGEAALTPQRITHFDGEGYTLIYKSPSSLWTFCAYVRPAEGGLTRADLYMADSRNALELESMQDIQDSLALLVAFLQGVAKTPLKQEDGAI